MTAPASVVSTSASFYVTGGTVPLEAASYVERQADKDLYNALLSGEYCFLLNARQMGKSSLTLRTRERLVKAGVRTIFLDLQRFGGGNVTAEQWYAGMLAEAGRQLQKRSEFLAFWKQNVDLPPVARLMEALVHVGLAADDSPLVLFIDEVDVIRSLPFSTDEFFSALRELYNRRTAEPDLKRLTCCLIGSATPADLISDTRVSPFNIGRRIELFDFTAEEASSLVNGLPGGKAVLDRVLFWTNGHPYLTQSLCAESAERSLALPAQIDSLVNELFFQALSRTRNVNLADVSNRVLQARPGMEESEYRSSILNLYRQMLRSKTGIPDDETDLLTSLLKLSGICRPSGGRLLVRNRIYERVFSGHWIEEHLPGAERRRQKEAERRGAFRATAIAGVVAAVFALLSFVAIGNAQRATENARQAASNAKREIIARQEADQARQEALARAADARRESERANSEAKRAIAGETVAKKAKQEALAFARARTVALAEAKAAGKAERDAREAGERLLYDANMQLAANLWDNERGGAKAVYDLLQQAIPKAGKTDYRDFTWRQLWYQVNHGDAVSVSSPLRGKDILWHSFTNDDDGTSPQFILIDKNYMFRHGDGTAFPLYKRRNEIALVTLSPGGNYAASVTKTGEITLWDCQKRKISWRKIGNKLPVVGLRFLRDGKTLTTTTYNNQKKQYQTTWWNTETGSNETPPGPAQPEVSFYEQASLDTSRDARISVFQFSNGVLSFRDNYASGTNSFSGPLVGHESTIYAAAISPDNRLIVSGDANGLVIVRAVNLTSVTATEVNRFTAQSTEVDALAFSPDGKILATGGSDGLVRLWSTTDWKPLRSFKGHRSSILRLRFSPRQTRLWSYDANNELRCWNTETSGTSNVLSPKGRVQGLASSSDGRSILVAFISTACLLDAASGKAVRTYPIEGRVCTATFSPDGKRVAIGTYDSYIYVCDTLTGKCYLTLQGRKPGEYRPEVSSLAFSPDGRLLAAGFGLSSLGGPNGNGIVRLWDTTTGKLAFTLNGFHNTTTGVAFSPDGKTLAVSSHDQTLSLFDVRSRRLQQRITFPARLCHVTYSPDGKTLALAGWDKTIFLLGGAHPGEPFRSLNGHTFSVHHTVFSPNGKTLVSAGWDKTVKFWDVETGRLLRTLTDFDSWVQRVAFSPDGKRLYTAQYPGTIRIWETEAPNQAVLAERKMAQARYTRWDQLMKQVQESADAKQGAEVIRILQEYVNDAGPFTPPYIQEELTKLKLQLRIKTIGQNLLAQDGLRLSVQDKGEGTMSTSKDGAYTIRVTRKGLAPWSVQLITTGMTLQAEHRYELRFRARVDGKEPRNIQGKLQRNFTPYRDIGYDKTHRVTDQWQTFQTTFTAQKNLSDLQIALTFHLSENIGTYHFSDISLRELPDKAGSTVSSP